MSGHEMISPVSSFRSSLIPKLVSRIGERGFTSELFALLSNECGAEHCQYGEMNNGVPLAIGLASRQGISFARLNYEIYTRNRCWEIDPALKLVGGSLDTGVSGLVHYPRAQLNSSLASRLYRRHTGDRLLLFGMVQEHAVLLALFRTPEQDQFEPDKIEFLQDNAALFLEVIAQHSKIVQDRISLVNDLSDLAKIEARLLEVASMLSHREVEVCARTIAGMTVAKTAIDMAIGEETVVTYRKRAYLRLGVSGLRELLVWYLTKWATEPLCGELTSLH